MDADGKKQSINSTSTNSTGPNSSNNIQPGEGIRSLKTSSAFRVLNFELYAKPNKVTMALGILGITISLGYLIYMNTSFDKSKYYVATSEDGSAILQPKKSRWE